MKKPRFWAGPVVIFGFYFIVFSGIYIEEKYGKIYSSLWTTILAIAIALFVSLEFNRK